MKKRFAVQSLAFVLSLLMVFGVSAPAMAEGGGGTEPPAPPVIDIRVGQIIPVRQLVEDMGYEWPDRPYSDIVTVSSGAVNCICHGNDWYVLYGASVGQGSVTISFRAPVAWAMIEPFAIDFNVTAASKPIVKNITVLSVDNIFLEPLLAKEGYTEGDVAQFAYWATKSISPDPDAEILYGGNWRNPLFYETTLRGESQILLNMKDGQIVLFNVTAKRSVIVLFGFEIPYFLDMSALTFPLNVLVFLVSPIDWVLNWISDRLFPLHDVTPALFF